MKISHNKKQHLATPICCSAHITFHNSKAKKPINVILDPQSTNTRISTLKASKLGSPFGMEEAKGKDSKGRTFYRFQLETEEGVILSVRALEDNTLNFDNFDLLVGKDILSDLFPRC